MIHYAQLENSPRLKRLLKFLSDGMPHTTREIIQQAQVCAVSTAIAELRKNGYEIECRPVRKGIYEYQLKKVEVKVEAEVEMDSRLNTAGMTKPLPLPLLF